MTRAAALVIGSLASLLVVLRLVAPDVRGDVAWGMLAPLVAVTATWVAVERTHRRDPARVMGVLMQAFLVKVLFFGAYVVVMVRVVGVEAMPFVVSFTSYFLVLYVVEAVMLQGLPTRNASGPPQTL
jgi:hypothetical protein